MPPKRKSHTGAPPKAALELMKSQISAQRTAEEELNEEVKQQEQEDKIVNTIEAEDRGAKREAEKLARNDPYRSYRHPKQNLSSERYVRMASMVIPDYVASEELKAQEGARAKEKTKQKIPPRPTHSRAPVCCVVGHVDSGKTALLHLLRRKVKGSPAMEEGCSGTSFFPPQFWQMSTEPFWQCRHPDEAFQRGRGVLVLPTPGMTIHPTGLPQQGATVCDIAVLVIDMMYGVEPGTREVLGALRERKTPFIVALSKVDRLYEWDKNAPAQGDAPQDILTALGRQKAHVKAEYEQRVSNILQGLHAEGIHAEPCYHSDRGNTTAVSVVPTSSLLAHGVPDLLLGIYRLQQRWSEDMAAKFLGDEEPFKCSVVVETPTKFLVPAGPQVPSLTAFLVSGALHPTAKVVVCTDSGPLHAEVSSVLTPTPTCERKKRNELEYTEHSEGVQGPICVKVHVTKPSLLAKVIPGTPLRCYRTEAEKGACEVEATNEIKKQLNKFCSSDGTGVVVQADTLGSAQSLLHGLQEAGVPIASAAIGLLQAKPIKTQLGRPCELRVGRYPHHYCVLALNVGVTDEAREFSLEHSIPIFSSASVHSLLKKYAAFAKGIKDNQRSKVVFPARLSVEGVVRRGNPVILSACVTGGQLRSGCPLLDEEGHSVGIAQHVENTSRDDAPSATKDDRVVFRLDPIGVTMWNTTPDETEAEPSAEAPPETEWGAHLLNAVASGSWSLSSRQSRPNIDLLKDCFREEMEYPSDWKLLKALAKEQGIPTGTGRKKPTSDLP